MTRMMMVKQINENTDMSLCASNLFRTWIHFSRASDEFMNSFNTFSACLLSLGLLLWYTCSQNAASCPMY